MTTPLPPLDAHAHVDVDIHPRALLSLRAFVLIALRSQAEFDSAMQRDDPFAVWGVGVHPGVPEAVASFDLDRLRHQLTQTPLLSEIGLDRWSSVPASQQELIFSQALTAHDEAACIASVHSAGRTGRVVEMLERHRCSTVVLHWWNGTASQTRRAVDLGCYFSINARNLRTARSLDVIPPERRLPETDHPYGDRGDDARPGNVHVVERALTKQKDDFRIRAWRNFGQLMDGANATERLPPKAQGIIDSVRRRYR